MTRRLPILRAVTVLALAGGAVAVAANVAPVDLSEGAATSAAAVRSAATATDLVCPGSPLTGTAGVPDLPLRYDARAVAAPGRVLSGLVQPGTPSDTDRLDLRTRATGRPVAQARGRVSDLRSTAATGPIAVQGRGVRAPGAVATQEWLATNQNTRGLASVPCQLPAGEMWLVGGGAQAGRQERLILTNTGANPVTADISVLAARGSLQPSAGRDIVVPAFGRTSVLVDAVGGTQAAGAVHVQVRGGFATATLVDRWLDGTTPAGMDAVSAAAPAATRQVIPVARLGQATLRVVAPGKESAVVRTRLLTASGRTALPEGVVTVRAGSSAELLLPPSAAGAQGIEITADTPVLAAVEVRRGTTGAPSDYAWAQAVRPTGPVAGAALPASVPGAGRVRVLTLTADVDHDLTVEVITSRGPASQTTEVTVKAGRTRNVSLATADAVWVRTPGPGELYASVTSTVGRGDNQVVTVSPIRNTRVADRAGSLHQAP